MNKVPRIIAVDLTPVLPGGENGGAKVFVLELLRRLAEMSPATEFVLLTQASSHDELAALDRPNMRRLMVVSSTAQTPPLRSRAKKAASRLLRHLPGRVHRLIAKVGRRFFTLTKRVHRSSFLKDMAVDLLFCPFTAPTYFEPGIPTVCTIYDLQYKTYPEFFSTDDVVGRDHTFIEACRKASALAAISDYSRDSAIAHGKLNPARISTIHLRMARRIVPTGTHDTSILGRLGLAPQSYLLYPANFWRHKNHEMLLTAFGMACHEGLSPDIKLVCTGAPGARQEWLQHAAAEMGLGDRVIFPGYVTSTELAALMSNCHGMLFPSLYEGFGLPVIEAMAAGIPVACSNSTSLPEVAAGAAILFDPKVPAQIAASILSLVKDHPLRTRLIQEGRQRAAEFADTERMAQEYWALFLSALNGPCSGHLISGVYVDGWMGPGLYLQLGPSGSAQAVEIELHVPKFVPKLTLTVMDKQTGALHGNPHPLKCSSHTTVSLPVSPVGASYELLLSPTFVPGHLDGGNDQRELSGILKRCNIVHRDGTRTPVFPEAENA